MSPVTAVSSVSVVTAVSSVAAVSQVAAMSFRVLVIVVSPVTAVRVLMQTLQ